MTGDPRFAPHNLHFGDPGVFRAMDPQLRELQRYFVRGLMAGSVKG